MSMADPSGGSLRLNVSTDCSGLNLIRVIVMCVDVSM